LATYLLELIFKILTILIFSFFLRNLANLGLLLFSMKNPLYSVEIIFSRKEFDEIWRLIKKLKRKDCAAAVSKRSRCYRAVRRAGWLKKSLTALFGLYKTARLGCCSPF
jgi:hypothetical protein